MKTTNKKQAFREFLKEHEVYELFCLYLQESNSISLTFNKYIDSCTTPDGFIIGAFRWSQTANADLWEKLDIKWVDILDNMKHMKTTHVRNSKTIQFYNKLSELLTKHNAKLIAHAHTNSDNETVNHIFAIIDNNQSIDITELSNTNKL